VDISQFVAGPYASRCLAALGAEVIKVERPPAGKLGRSLPHSVRGRALERNGVLHSEPATHTER